MSSSNKEQEANPATHEFDFHRTIELSKKEAIELIRQFFSKEWPTNEDEIEITRCQTGVNNQVYFVSRTNFKQSDREPGKLVIRKYGTKDGPKGEVMGDKSDPMTKILDFAATPIEQTVMMMELARQGLGPKLYGLIEDGRIEEMIDCHKISFEEARDPVLEADIAVNLARIHALDVPLKRPNYEFVTVLRAATHMMKKGLPFYENFGSEELLRIASHDYETEFLWLEKMLAFDKNRTVLMNWDPHLDNIAVLNNVKEGQLKTMIFDFEISGYNVRAKDLGLFLISRCGYFPICRSDQRLETKEEFTPFLQAYQEEVVRVKEYPYFDSEVNVDGKESIDHLWKESLLGGTVSCLKFLVLIAGVTAKKSGEGDFAQHGLKIMPSLYAGFLQCKQAIFQLEK